MKTIALLILLIAICKSTENESNENESNENESTKCTSEEYNACEYEFSLCYGGANNRQQCSCLTDFGNCLYDIGCADKHNLEKQCRIQDCYSIGFCKFDWNTHSNGNRLYPMMV